MTNVLKQVQAAASQTHSEICASDKFCVNTEGSYRCQQCDLACASCTGDGPDSCQECAKGYIKSGDVCMTEEAAAEANKTSSSSDSSPEDEENFLELTAPRDDNIKSEL